MIKIENLSHRFDARWVLRNIDFRVDAGESVAVMGSSGGGKTTLLRIIAGLETATEGLVTVDGIDVRLEPEKARARMGMVFQSAALFDYMTVLDNVAFAIRRRKRASLAQAVALAQTALKQVELHDVERKMPSELSGGMRKRVGIARAVALEPSLMLYDEPTTGLDPITTYAIDALIAQLRGELKVTSIVVSHDLNSVLRVADRVAFLHEGSIIFDGPPSEFAKNDHPAISELVRKAQATALTMSG